jgi:uncharacterized protein YwgA
LARKEKLDTNDIGLLLAAICFNNKPVKGRTRFQKMVFLLKEEYKIPFNFEFRPYYYGPYSDDFSDVLGLLTALNLTEEKTEYVGVGQTRYNYQLTDKGRKYVSKFRIRAEEDEQRILEQLKNSIMEINKLKTPELIKKAKSLMATMVH